MSSSEGKDVKRILKDKLDAPHLRDLARNPMQLAILLSLIHTRGSSLPDKRTALYDSYIELFFNREAEKSRIVRDHRALLIDIHRFLAWELHARSEVGKGRGNIGADELLSLLTAYLKAQEYDESLAGELFDGMIERVVAIVSRVQGTYEFEVQPLREYFAARHLYETAPYSPPGNERLGTKPERFDALAKNFFWLNVTRFYAGCYSVGELSSLVDGLRSLAESGDYNYISHPKNLAATLLSDWVFAQHPRSVKAVLALMLDGSGLPFYVSNLQRRRIEGSMIELPTEAGRRELLARAYSMLKQGDSEKRQTVIGQAIELINQNRGSQELRVEWEKDLSARKSVERARWLDYGVQLGYIGQSTIEQIEELYGNAELGISEVWGLLRSNKSAWLETNSYRFERALRAVVLYPAAVSANNGRNLFERLSLLLDPEAYTYLFAQAPGETAFDCLKYSMPWRGSFEGDASTSRTPTTQEGWVIHDKLVVEFQKPIAQWRSQIDPWSNVVEAIRPICGDHATALALSCIGANIRAPQETCTDAKELIDRTVPLARRVRYARLRAGQSSWWSRQLSSATRNDEIELVLAVLLLWGSPAVLQNLVGQISSSISTLSADAWIRFDETVSDVFESAYRYGSLGGPAALQTIPDADDRTMIALAWRMSPKQRRTFFVERLLGYGGDDMPTLCAQSSLAFGEIYSDTEWATQSLERICVAFQRGVAGRYKWINIGRRLSVTMAREVLKRSDRVPSFLLVHAEESLREAVGRAATPLIHVARANRWFQ